MPNDTVYEDARSARVATSERSTSIGRQAPSRLLGGLGASRSDSHPKACVTTSSSAPLSNLVRSKHLMTARVDATKPTAFSLERECIKLLGFWRN
jgi:hypothetical protein